jgi:hypothetical protein
MGQHQEQEGIVKVAESRAQSVAEPGQRRDPFDIEFLVRGHAISPLVVLVLFIEARPLKRPAGPLQPLP